MNETTTELRVTVPHMALVNMKRQLDKALAPQIEFDLNDSDIQLMRKALVQTIMHIKDAQRMIDEMLT